MPPDAPGRGSGDGWWPEGDDEGARKAKREDEGGGGKPPRGLASKPRSTRSPSRYSTFVGLAFVALILVALFNLLGDDSKGITLDEGFPLAEFAAPDALGTSDADANVAQDDCESSRNPCPADQRRTPACEISTDTGAIRVCDLFDKPLAISFWFTRGGDCIPSQNAFDEVASRYGGKVNFLSMNVRDSRETVADIVRDNGWQVPVGLDPDGAVSNLYRVGVCPTIVLAYPGGILYRTEIAPPNYTPDDVSGFIDQLLAATAKRESQSR
jgi:thiol-disulfide isomerase/thioredoxin